MADHDLPLDWPTAEQRERVEARVRALRARRRGLGAGATAVVIALVVALLVVVRGGSSHSVQTAASAPTTTAHSQPARPAIVSAPEPKGWRLVDYGDARLAFPPGWAVAPGTGTSPAPCATAAADTVVFYRSAPNCPTVTISALRGSLPPRPVEAIHGFRVYLVEDSIVSLTYAVPALHVDITLHDHAGDRVLQTLTSSARRVVLGGGAWPAVPRSWKPLTFGDVSVRVPPTMPVTHLASDYLAPGECSATPFRKSGAFVGNGVTGPISCPMIPGGVVPVPTDGVWMHTYVDPTAKFSAGTIEVGGLHLAVAGVPLYGPDALTSALDVAIFEPNGRHSTTIVRIGLGADPRIARTILASMRPAAPST